jgi:hypothetical protein
MSARMLRRSKNLLAGSMAVVLLLMVYAAPAAAGGTTRFVDDDGKANARSCDSSVASYATIRSAVIAAHNFDTILVCPGTYVGVLDLLGLFGVDLVARGNNPAVILAPTRSVPWLVNLGGGSPGDPGNTISGFTLRARGGTTGCGRVQYMIAGGGGAGLEVTDNIVAVQGSPTWGPCGYNKGIAVVADSDGLIQGNTVRNWREAGIWTGYRMTVLDNNLHFAHLGGTDCTGGFESVRYCAGTIGIDIVEQFSGAVALNTITPGTSFKPGGYLGTGIRLREYIRDSWVLNNTVERAGTSLRVVADLDVELEIGANILRYGSYGLRVTGSDASDDLLIHDNVSTLHTLWDCYAANTLGQTWTNNIGIKDSPESLCRDR